MAGCCVCSSILTIFASSTASTASETPISPTTLVQSVDLADDEGADYQNQLWQRILQDKISAAKVITRSPSLQNATVDRNATFDTSLSALTQQYQDHGFTKRLDTISKTLNSLKPFVACVSTMCQAHPEVAALVWGSIQLVFQCLLRATSVFEETGIMLQELSKALPRLHAYVRILHTPYLHAALREVYSEYIDFNFAVITILNKNPCAVAIKLQCSALGKEYDQARRSLISARTEFDAERDLANVEIQAERHGQIMEKLTEKAPGLGSSFSGDPITTVTTVRNANFTGRDEVLSQLHSRLEPSFSSPDVGKRVHCSCTIHGVGGMGKTQTALEYSYRYRASYTHIFWLKAESSSTILPSFLEISEKVGIKTEGLNTEKRIAAILNWLNTAQDPWLLIFDNAEDATTIRKFWPASIRGALVLTTQNPDLAHLTDCSIHLQAMVPAEGRALIQHYLQRGGSEQAAAERLSKELGGLPLAISHFAGYVARSQCTIDYILESFQRRAISSQIWEVDPGASTIDYGYTLARVWDLAFKRLSPDAEKLLHFLAFLNSDAIPEKMFIGPAESYNRDIWPYWDTHRFNEAIRILLERHLVDRYTTSTGSYLNTHRSLQRSVLHRLDKDIVLRQQTFDEVVEIVLKAFPERNFAKRGDTTLFPICEQYLPHVLALNNAYKQSDGRIEDSIKFAEVLYEAGAYAYQTIAQIDGLEVLETALEVSNKIYKTNPAQSRRVLWQTLGPLGLYNQYLGTKGRKRAAEYATLSISLIEEELLDVPSEKWTQADIIVLAYTANDKAITLAQFNHTEEAGEFWARSIGYYQRAGGEAALPARFGMTYSYQLSAYSAAQNKEKVREQAKHCIDLVVRAVGGESDLTLGTKFRVAVAYFTIGDISESLKLHKEVYETQLRLRGPSHQETLALQYNLAVSYQAHNDLANAELQLRDNLKHSIVTIQWRKEDEARTKFRLSLVLRLLDQTEEADRLRAEAFQSRGSERDSGSSILRDYTDMDDMMLFDNDVTLWHGRTSGIWSNGEKW